MLERLADDLEERQQLKSKLIGAALYPAIVSLVVLAFAASVPLTRVGLDLKAAIERLREQAANVE